MTFAERIAANAAARNVTATDAATDAATAVFATELPDDAFDFAVAGGNAFAAAFRVARQHVSNDDAENVARLAVATVAATYADGGFGDDDE